MQENNPVTTPEVTPQVIVGQPKTNNFLTILLSVLLIISVAISGFFAYQTQKLVNELNTLKDQEKVVVVSNVEPTVEPVATDSAVTADPTANWKTYTNTKYGFSVRYPSDLIASNEERGALFNLSLRQKNDVPNLNLNVYGTLEQSPTVYRERFRKQQKIGTINWDEYYYPVGNVEFGGPDPSKNAEVIILDFKKGVVTYEAVFYGQNALSPLQNQILSTFKFLE